VKKNMIIFIIGAVVIVLLDQLTKAIIAEKLFVYGDHKVIDGFFNLVYVMNPGAAFGFLAGASEIFRYFFFIGITSLAILLTVYYIIKSQQEKLSVIISMTLIFGGAVGNLIDRIRVGAVVDFLDFYIGRLHWPAFNVADSAITIGAVLMIWVVVVNRGKAKSS
jgi:signal peptidase II